MHNQFYNFSSSRAVQRLENNLIVMLKKFSKLRILGVFLAVFCNYASLFGQIEINNTNYTTLYDAFQSINNGLHSGVVVLQISGSTQEVQTAVLEKSGVGLANYDSVTFFLVDSNIVIEGDFSGPLLQLNGAEKVEINGFYFRDSQIKALTLKNDFNNFSNDVSVIELNRGASFNTLKGVIVVGSCLSDNSGLVTIKSSFNNPAQFNTIEMCDFTTFKSVSASENRPRYVVYAEGVANAFAEFNTIKNNRFIDVSLFSTRSNYSSANIYLTNYCSNWIIEGNHFFETTETTDDLTWLSHHIIKVLPTLNAAKGTNFIIKNNFIGGSADSSLGAAWLMHGKNNHQLTILELSTTDAGINIIENNYINNFSLSSNSQNPFNAFILNNAHATIRNNKVGKLGLNNSIEVFKEGVDSSEANVFLLSIDANNNILVENNFFSSIATIPKAISPLGIYGVYVKSVSDTGLAINILNNQIGDSTVINSMSCQFTGSYKQNLVAISSFANCYVSIVNNFIYNISNYAESQFAKMIGIEKSTPNGSNAYLIAENKIGNLQGNQANLDVNSTTPAGIFVTGTSFESKETLIRNNFIENLSNFSDGIGRYFVYGIAVQNSTGRDSKIIVRQNFINKLRFFNATNDTGKVAGIAVLYAPTTNPVETQVANNIIALESGPISNYGFYGILEWGSNDAGSGNIENEYLFNTVYISGTSSDTSQETAALRIVQDGTRFTRVIKNNVLVNERQGQTGFSNNNHFCIMLPTIVGNLSINSNNYYLGGGNGRALGKYGNNIHLGLSSWQNGPNSPQQDQASVDVNPNFVAVNADLPGYYYPLTSTIGEQILGLNIDFFNFPRASSPRMGAIETTYKIWNGRLSTDWGTADNWTPTGVPFSNEDIVVPENVPNYPALDLTRSVGKLFLEARASVDLNNQVFVISNTIDLGSEANFVGANSSRLHITGTGDVNRIEFSQKNTFTNTLRALFLARAGTVKLTNSLFVDSLILHDGTLALNDRAVFGLQRFNKTGLGILDASNKQAELQIYGGSTVSFNNNGITDEIGNLAILQIANWQLLKNQFITSKLIMRGGNILTGSDTLVIGQNTSSYAHIDYFQGTIRGTLKRWFGLQAYARDSSLFFPLGVPSGRKLTMVRYTNQPTVFGALVANFEDSFMGMNGIGHKIPTTGACQGFETDSVAFGFWNITPQNNLTGGTYDIILRHEGFIGSILDVCGMTAVRRLGAGAWEQQGVHVPATGFVNAPILRRNNVTGWSNWGLAYQKLPSPLPVDLLVFNAQKRGSKVYIHWETTNEINNSHFLVERSANAHDWKVVGKINAKEIPDVLNTYSLWDEFPASGINYYRLIQVDLNGTFSVSPIRVVQFKNESSISVYPVPARDFVQIKSDINISNISVFDLNGRMLFSLSGISQKDIELNCATLATGIYLINLELDDNQKIANKFMVY